MCCLVEQTGPVTGALAGATVTMGGDVTGTSDAATVAKIKGTSVGTTTGGSGKILVGSGSAFAEVAVSGDATLAANGALSLATDSVATNELVNFGTLTGTAGNILVADGVDFESVAMTGDVTITSGGVTSLATDSVATNELVNFGTLTGTSGNILVADGTDFESVAMSGDATLASTGSLTLANSGVSANTYGSGSLIPVITVDAKGRITAASTSAVSGALPSGTASQTLYNAAGTWTATSFLSNNLTTVGINSPALASNLAVKASGAAVTPFSIELAGSQSANGIRVEDSAGLEVLTLGPTGSLIAYGTLGGVNARRSAATGLSTIARYEGTAGSPAFPAQNATAAQFAGAISDRPLGTFLAIGNMQFQASDATPGSASGGARWLLNVGTLNTTTLDEAIRAKSEAAGDARVHINGSADPGTNLQVTGGAAFNVQTGQSATPGALITGNTKDYYVQILDELTLSGVSNYRLPSSPATGQTLVIFREKDTGASSTVTAASAIIADNTATLKTTATLGSAGASITLVYTGSRWKCIATFGTVTFS